MAEETRGGGYQVQLSPAHAERLNHFARVNRISAAEVVERALDILFGITALIADGSDDRAWSSASADALARVWDNDDDAVYDNWRELYDVSAG